MYSETSSGRRESDIAIGKQAVPWAPAERRVMVSGSGALVLPPKTPAIIELATESNQTHLPFLQQWLVFSGAESKPNRCIVV